VDPEVEAPVDPEVHAPPHVESMHPAHEPDLELRQMHETDPPTAVKSRLVV
jgi:hypothetical protein